MPAFVERQGIEDSHGRKFRAFPEEISGLERLVFEISSQTTKSYKYFKENAVPDAADAGALLGTLVALPYRIQWQ
ncbi:hypothetical protein HQP03_08685 [Rhodococcus fascians]|nr:hypothetical protein [Rhodococcus fascians]MBY4051062.1 hypothetical protein [Rhodococcus fascians]MBY4097558.1 hypothetical protein [Rhodococcus fascians]MBY4104087.1 hypothetical protein [Rhodococcus fascians]